MKNASYPGPDRRRHRIYVTRNTEYHFRGRTCVAVRDRTTGHFLDAHLALYRRLSGKVRFTGEGGAIPSLEAPEVGEALFFGDDGRELVTSVLCSIDRPDKTLVASYPPAAASC
jgi:hypothetical protein